MPNWCQNTIEIYADTEKLDAIEKYLVVNEGKDWFDAILPCPQELKDVGNVSFHEKSNEALVEKYGHGDWYSWSVENWGCKWNCDANDWIRDEKCISFWFDSPWGPPIALYHNMEDTTDYSVTAYYCEEGVGFAGKFEDGIDECYEYSDLASLEDIPEDIVEQWDLQGRLEDLEEMYEEDEQNGEENGSSNKA